jgi:hypothetical protein
MRSPKSLHNLQHDEGGNYMAETETENYKPFLLTENFHENMKALDLFYTGSNIIPSFTSKCSLSTFPEINSLTH